MADISDPQALTFCNNYIRPGANLLAGLIPFAQSILTYYTAKNLGPIFGHPTDLLTNVNPPNYTTFSGNVLDSAVTGPDGRTPITTDDVAGFLRIMLFLTNSANAVDTNFGTAAQLANKIAVQPTVVAGS